MKTPFLQVIYALFSASFLFAQHQETGEKPSVYKGGKNATEDSSSLLFAFKHGDLNGHFRYFFMATDNASGLSDYFANAGGGGLHYNTARFHNFQFGISGFYVFNLYSSPFDAIDSTTGQTNRYELGLFDVEDPLNHKDIDRLEELYLKYHLKETHFTLGRQLINTPFINLQDGRMRPTGVEGIWIESTQLKNTKIEGGYIYAVSPRSTTKWYNIEESIGIYPSGVNIDGSKSNYHDHLSSGGVGMLGITNKPLKWLKFQLWDLYTDNIFNSALAQVDVEIPTKKQVKFYTSAQFIRQDALNDGGNVDPSKTYFTKNGKAMTFGGRIGLKTEKWDVSANFNHITDHGRYLMPREWGRDPFFTFMPRERNEGVGNSTAAVLKMAHKIPKYRIQTSLMAGYINMPDVKNTFLNKYGFPSYYQINADVRYAFAGFLKGLDVQVLAVAKINAGETYGNDRFVINKVNMVTYNLVLNYHF
jgi:hypothetical protein